MARLFASASSQCLIYSGAVLSGTPLTLACWFKATTLPGNRVLLGIQQGATTAETIRIQTNSSGNVATVYHSNINTSSTATSTGVWSHACGVFSSSSSRSVFLDGGGKVTNSDAVTAPSGLDRTTIACRGRTTPDLFYDGSIAEAGIWNAALDDSEVATLAKGVSPLLVRPQSLVAYWPLLGRTDPEIDVRGGFGMSLTNSPTAADHPRIYYPTPRIIYSLPAAAAPTGNPWNYYAQCG